MNIHDWNAKDILLLALAGFTLVYLVALVAGMRRAKQQNRDDVKPTVATTVTGFIVNFFDTLGIGSFATTTAIVRHWRLVKDGVIPGTLNVGHTPASIAEAFIFTALVPVESITLISMIAAAVAGAWLGAGVVAAWPKRKIQIGMGLALLIAAGLMLMTQLKLFPGGGDALALTGPLLWAGIIGNFILGALMTLGIGLFGPCMILVSLLGMNPIAAFPIMMGSCAFLMPVASLRFIKAGAYNPGASLAFALGGIPAVLIAAFIVKSLPLTAIRYLVVVVVLYASVSLLLEARKNSKTAS